MVIQIMQKENSLQIFRNETFGEVRVIQEDGKALFVASDVAKALGYSNPRKAVGDHCKGVTKRDIGVQTGLKANGTPALQNIGASFIPESDVIRLIMRSKLPTAEQYQDWVFEEVLPAIHKQGGYMVTNVNESDEDIMARALNIANETLRRRAERIKQLESKQQEDKPKVLFADAVATSKRSCLVHELAKIIAQNGVNIGQNRLFSWLREKGYLCSKGEFYNQPSQRSMEMGLFEIKKTTINKPDGTVLVSNTTKVTGKGQIYFVNKFLKQNEKVLS